MPSTISFMGGAQIRTVGTREDPWFNANDLAEFLKYTNPQAAIRKHVDSNDRTQLLTVLTGCTSDAPLTYTSNELAATYVNEFGVYSLALGSKLPSAKAFKRWVVSELLPGLRKTGEFRMGAQLQTLQSELTNQRLLTDQTARILEEQKKIAADAQLLAETEQKNAENARTQAEADHVKAENDKKELIITHDLETKDKDATIAAKDTQIAAKDKVLDRLTVVKNDFVKDKQKLTCSESIYIISNFMLWKDDTFKVGSTRNLPSERASGLSAAVPPNDPLIVLYEFKCHSALPLEKYIHNTLSSQRLDKNRELFVMPLDRLYMFVRDIVDADRQIITLGNEHISVTYTSIVPKGTAAEARYAEIKAEEKARVDAKLPKKINLAVDELQTLAIKSISDWKAARVVLNELIEFNWLAFQPSLLEGLNAAGYAKRNYKAREWKMRIRAQW